MIIKDFFFHEIYNYNTSPYCNTSLDVDVFTSCASVEAPPTSSHDETLIERDGIKEKDNVNITAKRLLLLLLDSLLCVDLHCITALYAYNATVRVYCHYTRIMAIIRFWRQRIEKQEKPRDVSGTTPGTK